MQHATLILSKDGPQDVSVSLKKDLPQHQLDGIRFLYRQFKLKHPGVILNDPTGYGKRLQVVLFLNAISPLLKALNKPMLILCHEDDIQNWTEHFLQWTDCYNEVTTNSATPFSRSAIFINPLKDCLTFGRRQWGIVVVCSDAPSKEVLQSNVKGDFKIWVSNYDFKENLQSFTSIYKWLYPKETFDINHYTPADNSVAERINKTIKLDAFLEDIALRRKIGKEPFDVPQKPDTVTQKKVKNKDPTGLKVKRSKKRKIDEENEIISAKSNTNYSNVSIDKARGTEEDTSKISQTNSNSKTYSLSSISDNDPMINEFNFLNKPNDIKDDYECDNENTNQNGFKNFNRLRRKANIYTDTEESMDFESAINDIVYHENQEINDSQSRDLQNKEIPEETVRKSLSNEDIELGTDVFQTCKNLDAVNELTNIFTNNNIRRTVNRTDHTYDFQTQIEKSDILESILNENDLQNTNSIQNNKNNTEEFQTCRENIIIPETPTEDSTELPLLNPEGKYNKTHDTNYINNLSNKSQIVNDASRNNYSTVDKSVYETADNIILNLNLNMSQNGAGATKNSTISSTNDLHSSKTDEASTINVDTSKIDAESTKNNEASKNNVDKSNIYTESTQNNDASTNNMKTSNIHAVSSKKNLETSEIEAASSENNVTSKKDTTVKNESSNKPKTILSSLKDMDDKLIEYEKQAKQRFKGSIFDTLFNK